MSASLTKELEFISPAASGGAERTWSALIVEVVILFILNEATARRNHVTAFEAEKGGSLILR